MGRPTRRKPARGLSRRQFLQRARWLPAAAGVLPLADALARGNRASAQATTETVFAHGVASGDPTAEAIVFWTRISGASDGPIDVQLELSRTVGFDVVMRSIAAVATADRDWTVKLDVGDLLPGTTYYYRFICGGVVSPVARSRTLPVGSVERLRLAVVSCASYPHGYFNAYARVAERADLDAVVHVGDYIYEYADGVYGDVRSVQPTNETVTMSDYRTRHAWYKTDPDLQALHRQHPIIAMWDDHETADNAWAGGAVNHQPASEGDWSTRVSGALQAYFEWMPLREPVGDLRAANKRYTFGDLADLHTLESRLSVRAEQLRANNDTDLPVFTQTGEFADPSREMIGSAQEQWLADGLHSSGARWHLLAQGVMFAQLQARGLPELAPEMSTFLNPDQWDGYAPARQRIYDIIGSGRRAIDNVVVLTGDIHSSWAADLTPDPNSPAPGIGYDPLTGKGSRAVEFVGTSVTSPALDGNPGLAQAAVGLIHAQNPHMKYAELTRKGYLLLDVQKERLTGEFWYVDTIAEPSGGQAMAAAFATRSGKNHLEAAVETSARSDAPPLAV